MSAIFLREARDNARARRMHFLFWGGFLLFAGAILFALTLNIGKSIGYQQAKAEQAAAKPAMAPVQSVDVLAGNCIEYARACFARKRMERVKAGT